MIYLDTHLLIWIAEGNTRMLSRKAESLINGHDVFISPIVLLELQYLYEIGKAKVSSNKIMEILKRDIGLIICPKDFNAVIEESIKHIWTRDPFDRIITAQASLEKNKLPTRDRSILTHYKYAIWE